MHFTARLRISDSRYSLSVSEFSALMQPSRLQQQLITLNSHDELSQTTSIPPSSQQVDWTRFLCTGRTVIEPDFLAWSSIPLCTHAHTAIIKIIVHHWIHINLIYFFFLTHCIFVDYPTLLWVVVWATRSLWAVTSAFQKISINKEQFSRICESQGPCGLIGAHGHRAGDPWSNVIYYNLKDECWWGSYLSRCAGHRQVAAVFTEVDLLDAEPWVVAVGVKTAHLTKKRWLNY